MLKSFSHTGVGVANLDETIALYEQLGFTVTKRFDKPALEAEIAWVEKGEIAIELLEFHNPDHPHLPFIKLHTAFMSDDLEADVQELVDQGYRIVIPIEEGILFRYAFVEDAAGAVYEIATEKSN